MIIDIISSPIGAGILSFIINFFSNDKTLHKNHHVKHIAIALLGVFTSVINKKIIDSIFHHMY